MKYYTFSTFLFNKNKKTESVIIIGKNKTKTEYDYDSIVFKTNKTTIKLIEKNEKESIITLQTVVANINKITDEMLFSYYFFSLIQISIFCVENIKKIIHNILINKDKEIQTYIKLLEIEDISEKLKIGYIYTNEHLQKMFNIAKILYIIEKNKKIKKELVLMQLKIQ